VPDSRSHRGPHPEDARLFASAAWPQLREAAADLCWLLGRGYGDVSSLKLVGDRHSLVARQRTAVRRCVCSDAQLARREAHKSPAEALEDRHLWLDGYNVLTTIEAALAGGVILAARDGCYRDMASMHGSYRKVAETRPALELIGRATAALRIAHCLWFLDRPVSNSGRLGTIIRAVAKRHDWSWEVELVGDPDTVLAETERIVATADSGILDRVGTWFNLARHTIVQYVPQARIVELAGSR